MIDGNLLQTTRRSFDLNGHVTVKSMDELKRKTPYIYLQRYQNDSNMHAAFYEVFSCLV